VPLQQRPRTANAWVRIARCASAADLRKATSAGRGCESPRARRTSGRRWCTFGPGPLVHVRRWSFDRLLL